MYAPHAFLAESNLICNLCQEVLTMREEGNLSGILDLFNELPALERKFNEIHFDTYAVGPNIDNQGFIA